MSKVFGQSPVVSTASNLNPSNSKGFDFCQNGIWALPRNLKVDQPLNNDIPKNLDKGKNVDDNSSENAAYKINMNVDESSDASENILNHGRKIMLKEKRRKWM